MDRRLVIYGVLSILIASQIILLTNLCIREPRLGASMRWLNLPGIKCGEWPALDFDGAMADIGVNTSSSDLSFAIGCRGSAVEEMPQSPDEEITARSCMTWCRADNRREVEGGRWCCQLTYSDEDGTRCRWYNGSTALVEVAQPTIAYSACPVGADSGALLGAPHVDPGASAADECPDVTMVLMGGEGPGLCSEVCLPLALVNLSRTYGLTEGTCSDKGCTTEVYSAVAKAVHYTVYECVDDAAADTDAAAGAEEASSLPSSTLSFLEPVGEGCGVFPPTTRGVGYACSGGKRRAVMPRPIPERKSPVSPEDCETFCSGKVGEGCCEQAPDPRTGGGVCSWVPGGELVATLPSASSAQPATAFVPCAEAPAALGASHSPTELVCPADRLQTAMKLNGDGPGLCSQICLPKQLWGAAQRHGVTEGTCKEEGYTHFDYSSSSTGVPYNCYSKATTHGDDEALVAPDEADQEAPAPNVFQRWFRAYFPSTPQGSTAPAGPATA